MVRNSVHLLNPFRWLKISESLNCVSFCDLSIKGQTVFANLSFYFEDKKNIPVCWIVLWDVRLEPGCDLEPVFVSSSARLPKSHQRGGEESFDRGLAQPGDDGGGGQVRRPAFDRRQQGLRRLCPAPDATLQSAEEAPPQIRIPGKFSATTYLLSPIVITIAQKLQVKQNLMLYKHSSVHFTLFVNFGLFNFSCYNSPCKILAGNILRKVPWTLPVITVVHIIRKDEPNLLKWVV